MVQEYSRRFGDLALCQPIKIDVLEVKGNRNGTVGVLLDVNAVDVQRFQRVQVQIFPAILKSLQHHGDGFRQAFVVAGVALGQIRSWNSKQTQFVLDHLTPASNYSRNLP
jgi:hypothetical protein